MNRFPSKAVLLTDFYLAKPDQNRPRIKLAKQASEMGVKRFGGEFLFMNNSEVADLKKKARMATEIKSELDGLFDETYFSVHSPWVPWHESAFELKNEAVSRLSNLCRFCPDFVKAINLHAGFVPKEFFDAKIAQNFEEKKGQAEKITQMLAPISDQDDRLCVETLFSDYSDLSGVSYLTNLPSGLQMLTNSNQIGSTVDTAHSGITIRQCQWMMKTRRLLNGFFEEDWKEIKTVARKGMDCFADSKNSVRHVHWNDFEQKNSARIEDCRDGRGIGLGSTQKEEIFLFMEKLVENSRSKRVGVTLEIQEEDYMDLKNSAKSIQTIGDHYGFGN